jgi:hypothetical protein
MGQAGGCNSTGAPFVSAFPILDEWLKETTNGPGATLSPGTIQQCSHGMGGYARREPSALVVQSMQERRESGLAEQSPMRACIESQTRDTAQPRDGSRDVESVTKRANLKRREPGMSKQITEYKHCAHCDNLISPGHGARRKYCNQACKQAAYRERKELSRAGSVTLSRESNK